ncbi:hypothetical protein O1611_g2992 [Lasiodiplodia mahajangana]|uniref:Uncharacterized protein n=1 Tax=Lasiodiplodia mahajangana TaxID=1108764 RepID=A0ACC2JTP1_9PEZI|nr:hypothetical protein O1611_g2992 [Lasiodiplodia mahajangana]
MAWVFVMIFAAYIFTCWIHSVSSPVVSILIQVLSGLLQLVWRASIQLLSPLKRRFSEYRQSLALQSRIIGTVHCENCVFLQNEVNELEARLVEVKVNGKAFDNSLRRVWNEQRIELESDLNEARAQLQQTTHFLRAAESQINHQRRELRSLTEELQLARESNSNPDFRTSLAMHNDLEQLRHRNAQLTTNNLQQWNDTLAQKQRAEKAEREADSRAGWITALTLSQRDLRQELAKAQKQLQHQTRRADEQREIRVRLEVENEGLGFATLRRNQDTMYT